MDVCYFGFRLIHIVEHELAQSSEHPTFPSSSSLAPSVLSGKESPPQSNTNNNDSLPRRLHSNVKCTYFSGASALIPRMRLLTGRSAVMSGVPWEPGCTPRELHQKEMDIFGAHAPPQQQQPQEREASVPDAGRGSSLRRAEASSSRVRSNRSMSVLITRSGRMWRRGRRIWRLRRAQRRDWGSNRGKKERKRGEAKKED
jgi:hypothetical protein